LAPHTRTAPPPAMHLSSSRLRLGLVGVVLIGTSHSAPVAVVQQFGMCQCPMTSSWFTAFYDGCLKSRPAMQKLVRFSQHYVGGTEGGPVNGSTWNSSFHGYDEVMGDRYQLCARDLDPRPPHTKWLGFEACQNGLGGVVGIVDIPRNSKKCAWQAGLGWEALRACAEGERGLELYHSSVLFTAANCAQPPFVCYDFPKSVVDPDGQGHGLPVIKIGGRMHYGLDAYTNLTQRICAVIAGTGAECGCDEELLTRRRATAHRVAGVR
jgi:hypothetical protein